ncbi:MAG: hypothetical protein ACE15C_21490 [Phycisphaerae bacterium]
MSLSHIEWSPIRKRPGQKHKSSPNSQHLHCLEWLGDLLKLSIYIRQVITRPALREYIQKNHPQTLEFFESLLSQGEPKAAG